jgi:uncharacterized membrane protein
LGKLKRALKKCTPLWLVLLILGIAVVGVLALTITPIVIRLGLWSVVTEATHIRVEGAVVSFRGPNTAVVVLTLKNYDENTPRTANVTVQILDVGNNVVVEDSRELSIDPGKVEVVTFIFTKANIAAEYSNVFVIVREIA